MDVKEMATTMADSTNMVDSSYFFSVYFLLFLAFELEFTKNGRQKPENLRLCV